MACVLLTGGRAPVTLELARLFARSGHRVLVAESQRAQVTRASRAVDKTFNVPPPRQQPAEFISALVEIVKTENVDLLLPTCEEVFYVSRGRSEFPNTCRVFVDDFATLSRLHDKWEFNQEAPQGGLLTPASYLLTSEDELKNYLHLSGRWVLKPAFSRFGSSVLYGSIDELQTQVPKISEVYPWVLQQFVEGEEYCVYGVVDGGQLRALSVYGHEFVAGKAGICFQEISQPEIEESVKNFVRHLNFTGQIAFDFIIENGKAYALECNPRSTSGIHLLATQKDFADVFLTPGSSSFVRAAIGDRAMLGLAMFSFGLGQVDSLAKFKQWLKVLRRSREVMFQWRDPVPFVDQLICVMELAWQSRRSRMDLLSASTVDIEWNGER